MTTKEQVIEYFEYLDDLRESGVTNMFGARPYIVRQFGLQSDAAGRILSGGMSTDLNLPADARAEAWGLLEKGEDR